MAGRRRIIDGQVHGNAWKQVPVFALLDLERDPGRRVDFGHDVLARLVMRHANRANSVLRFK